MKHWFCTALVAITSGMLLLSNLSYLGQRNKDSAHLIAITLPREGTYFLGPILGWYLNHWFHSIFAMLAFETIISIIYRSRLQRR